MEVLGFMTLEEDRCVFLDFLAFVGCANAADVRSVVDIEKVFDLQDSVVVWRKWYLAWSLWSFLLGIDKELILNSLDARGVLDISIFENALDVFSNYHQVRKVRQSTAYDPFEVRTLQGINE